MGKQTRKKSTASRRKAGSVKGVATNKAVRKPAAKKPKAQAAGVTAPTPKLLLAENPRPAAAPTTKKQLRFPAPAWRKLALFGGAGLAALLLAWAAGNMFFTTVHLGSKQLSARTSDARLAQIVSTDAANYRLSVIYPDKHSQAYTLADIGLHVEASKTVRDIRDKQHGLMQRLAWWRPVNAELHAVATTTTLNTFIAQHASIITRPAKDASIGIDNGTVKINAGNEGKQYGLTNAAARILTSAIQLRAGPLVLAAVPLEPNVSMPALASAKTKLEATLNQKITITIGDQTVTPSPTDIADWLMLTPTTKGVDVSVNADKLHDYLQSVASDNTTAPRSQITDGSGAVVAKGVRGTVVTGTDDAQDQIDKSVLSGSGVNVSLAASLTPFKTVVSPGSGRWIEVDLTTKRMYAYDDNAVTRSFLVSAGAAATPTVTGRFAVYSKYRTQNMYGGNADGTNYFQPNVPYVNYFYQDYAIHGNYWRPASYFGNINSSHGCVGINVNDGAWMYSWATVGTPVVVHY
jgi:lipoprotein-anchoring transpeptidase ErfK/SrfK